MRYAALWALLALSGCATEPRDTIVHVPVPVECRQEVPERPVMPTEELASPVRIDPWVAAAQAEIEVREAYELRLRAGLVACTSPIELPKP